MKYSLIFLESLLLLFFSCKSEKKIERPLLASLHEQHRPAYHFTPDSMWMNDPNGMVYHDGEYHLFYQYFPDSTVWGPMHWGHAVSKDMVHWEHLPIALYPDSLGLIFSGSAVIDKGNTSGFGKDGKDPMVAIFTHHNLQGEKSGAIDFQYQSIAYSLDNGRTFTKYEGNPVVKNPGIKDFRDPKVLWHETNKTWVMVLAAYDKAIFYTSPNLKDWTKTGEFGIPGDTRLWECPDLFQMQVEGSKEKKWVLITSIQQQAPNGGTATSYFVGDFDGQTFIGDPKDQKWLDYGTDNYALVTWSNVPDGRTLAMGWMSNWLYAQQVPTKRWRSAMTLARELTLHLNDKEYSLRSSPVKELSKLELETDKLKPQKITSNLIISEGSTLLKLKLKFNKPHSGTITLRFSNDQKEYLDVGFVAEQNTYFIDRTHSGNYNFSKDFEGRHIGKANYKHDEINMAIYLDRSSVELFADGGQCVMTDIFFPSSEWNKIEILPIKKDAIILKEGTITQIRPTIN